MLSIITIITAFIIGSSVNESQETEQTAEVTLSQPQYWQHDVDAGWVYLAPDVEVDAQTDIVLD